MALPVKDQIRYWGIATAAFLVILWFLGDVILPFVLGGAIAYFLDPVADRLERLGASRAVATTVITLSAVLVFVLMALLVVPLLVQQAVSLFETAPKLFQDLQAFLTVKFPSIVDQESVLRRDDPATGWRIAEHGADLGQLAGGYRPSVRDRAGGGLLSAL